MNVTDEIEAKYLRAKKMSIQKKKDDIKQLRKQRQKLFHSIDISEGANMKEKIEIGLNQSA